MHTRVNVTEIVVSNPEPSFHVLPMTVKIDSGHFLSLGQICVWQSVTIGVNCNLISKSGY